ncbi:hypothetical protein BC940DRAFT_367920 [Gongronella butleri]|nr:hypothetical protein BC940DRAFT_367920 [Gongronella butleri]
MSSSVNNAPAHAPSTPSSHAALSPAVPIDLPRTSHAATTDEHTPYMNSNKKAHGPPRPNHKTNQYKHDYGYNSETGKIKHPPSYSKPAPDHVRAGGMQQQKPSFHRQGKGTFNKREPKAADNSHKDKLFTQPFVPQSSYTNGSPIQAYHHAAPAGMPLHAHHPSQQQQQQHPQPPYTASQAYSSGSLHAMSYYVPAASADPATRHAGMPMHPGWPMAHFYATTAQPVYDPHQQQMTYSYMYAPHMPHQVPPPPPSSSSAMYPSPQMQHPPLPVSSPSLGPQNLGSQTSHRRASSSTTSAASQGSPHTASTKLAAPASPYQLPQHHSSPNPSKSKAIAIINPDTGTRVNVDIAKSVSTSSRSSTTTTTRRDIDHPAPPSSSSSSSVAATATATATAAPVAAQTSIPNPSPSYLDIMDPAIREREEREAQEQLEQLRQKQLQAQNQQDDQENAAKALASPEKGHEHEKHAPVPEESTVEKDKTENDVATCPEIVEFDVTESPIPTRSNAPETIVPSAAPATEGEGEGDVVPTAPAVLPQSPEITLTDAKDETTAPITPPMEAKDEKDEKNDNEKIPSAPPSPSPPPAIEEKDEKSQEEAKETGHGLSNGILRYDPVFLMQFMPLCMDIDEDLSMFQNMQPVMKRQPSTDRHLGRNNASNTSSAHQHPNVHQHSHAHPPQQQGQQQQGQQQSQPQPQHSPSHGVQQHYPSQMGFQGARSPIQGNTHQKYAQTTPRQGRHQGGGANHEMQREGSMGRHGGKPSSGAGGGPTRGNTHYASPSSMGATTSASAYNITNVIAAVTASSYHGNNNNYNYNKARTPSNDPLWQPLPKSENRWVPPSTAKATTAATSTSSNSSNSNQTLDPKEMEKGEQQLSQEDISRKIKGLLNKLTLEKFDTISDKIIMYCAQSRNETDGKSLRTVIKLVFDKACDEAAFAPMWAQLCRKIDKWMPADITDVTILDKQGNPLAGHPLYCKYLFSRCQREFERGWAVALPQGTDTAVVLSDEYYAAAKIKRQGLGLVQFIGELYRLGMLTENIIYGCLKRLSDYGAQAREEEVESLCKLLTTVGKDLDKNTVKAPMFDVIYSRMQNELYSSPHLSSRVKFMIQDLIELRKNKWVPRRSKQDGGPKTIAEIHELAEKEKEEASKRAAHGRGNGGYAMGRQGSQQVGGRNGTAKNGAQNGGGANGNGNGGGKRAARTGTTAGNGNDGWNTVPGSTQANTGNSNNRRVNDLSNFGKAERTRTRTNVLGPSSSPFAALNKSAAHGIERKASTNKFSSLLNHEQDDDTPALASKESLRPSSGTDTTTKDSIKSQAAVATDHTTKDTSPLHPDTTTLTRRAPPLDEAKLKRRITNSLDEYFAMANIKDLLEDLAELDQPDKDSVLATLLLGVVEKKQAQVDSVCALLPQLYAHGALEKTAMQHAFQTFIELYEDLVIDVPQAPKLVAQLLVHSDLTLDDVWQPTQLGPCPENLQNAYTDQQALAHSSASSP